MPDLFNCCLTNIVEIFAGMRGNRCINEPSSSNDNKDDKDDEEVPCWWERLENDLLSLFVYFTSDVNPAPPVSLSCRRTFYDLLRRNQTLVDTKLLNAQSKIAWSVLGDDNFFLDITEYRHLLHWLTSDMNNSILLADPETSIETKMFFCMFQNDPTNLELVHILKQAEEEMEAIMKHNFTNRQQ